MTERASPPSLEEWLKRHKRVAEMLTKDDWVSVWIGLATFAVAWPFAASGVSVIWDYGDDDVIVGIASLVMLMVLPLVVLGRRFLKADEVLPGFALMFILALAGRAIGSQQMMRQVGLGATVWTLVLGMFLSNVVARYTSIKVIEPAAKLAEFFIKIGLVLLAIELSSLGQYGVAGLLVAWCVTPVCVAVIYCVGTRFIAPDCSRSLVCLLAAGISVCGGSAITATASAIKAPPEEQALAISLVSFFTIFYMLALPYIALALGINLSVASAWIGGSVNNTGNVVASVAILDAAAQRIDGGSCPGPGCPSEMGPVIKMAQNAVLGVVTVVISIYWMTYEEEDEQGGASATDIEMGVSDKVLKARGLAQSDAVAAVAAATAAAEQGAESPEQGAGRQEPGVGAGSPAGDVSGEGGKDAEVTGEASGKIELQLVGGDGGGASAAEGAGEVAEAVAVGSAAGAALVADVGAAPADPHAAPAEPDVVGAAVASTRDAGGDPAGGQGERGDGERGKVASGAKRQWPGAIALWDRFPKFVLGFLVLSCVISALAMGPMGVAQESGSSGIAHGGRALDVLLEDLNRGSNWWFYIGFVGIGINTNVAKMAQKLKGGSILNLYLAGQSFNVVATLVVAWLAFDVAGLGPHAHDAARL